GVHVNRTGKQYNFTPSGASGDYGFRAGAGELQVPCYNRHRYQRAAANLYRLYVEAVLGEVSGVFGHPYGKVGWISGGTVKDTSPFLSVRLRVRQAEREQGR